MNWFKDCQTIDELKARYKQLAKEHHPDRGGNLQNMQEINFEYDVLIARFLKGEDLTEEEYQDSILYNELYRNAIEKLSGIEELTLELVGAWIWVTGNTYPHRQTLKNAGYSFAPVKKAWYFRSENYKFRNKGESKSLDEIKDKYGSETISRNSKKRHLN